MTWWVIALVVLATMGCQAVQPPIAVAVVFGNEWKLGDVALTESEKSRIKAAAMESLREAFRGFAVRFVDGGTGDRTVVVEDTPYSSPMYLGSVGVTGALAIVSRVRFDSLYYAELAVVRCEDVVHCAAKTRAQLVDGLGRGIGATAAHELGHQRGFGFTRHAACDDCYDGVRSTSYAHFFGEKHWSADAVAIMRSALRQP